MYRILKEQGYGRAVVLENINTKDTLQIGVPSLAMHTIFDEAGLVYPSVDLEWNIVIKDTEVAEKLMGLAMKMKRPIRDQRKVNNTADTSSPAGEVDAFDLIFGNV